MLYESSHFPDSGNSFSLILTSVFYKDYQEALYWHFLVKLVKVLNFRGYFENFMRTQKLQISILLANNSVTNSSVMIKINQHFLIHELYRYFSLQFQL